MKACNDGVESLLWPSETFAYADQFDEQAQRWLGLKTGQLVHLQFDSPGFLVKSNCAAAQLARDAVANQALNIAGASGAAASGSNDSTNLAPLDSAVLSQVHVGSLTSASSTQKTIAITHVFGSIALDAARPSRDLARFNDEILTHLVAIGGHVELSLEVNVKVSVGLSEQVLRTLTENARTLGYRIQFD